MILRRVAALFVLLTTFHFSVVAGDLACADHGASAAASSHAMPMDMGASHDVHAAAAESAEPPCEVPAQQHCCEAVAGCSITGVASSPERPAGQQLADARAVRHPASRALSSLAVAPEPPPPKA